MIKKWSSYNESDDFKIGSHKKASDILTTAQIKEINHRIQLIESKKLYVDSVDGFWTIQPTGVVNFIEECEGILSVGSERSKFQNFGQVTIEDLVYAWTFSDNKPLDELKTLLKGFLKAKLTYPDIDNEINEILIELKDEYEYEELIGCDEVSNDKHIMYYRVTINNIKEYNADFDSHTIIPSTMIKLLTICRKIEQKVEMIKWKCSITDITDGDSPDGIVLYIYKNIEV